MTATRHTAMLLFALLLIGATTRAIAETPSVVLYDPQYSSYSNFQVAVARADGHLSTVKSLAEYKAALARGTAVLLARCTDVEVVLTTIRFVERGGRAALFCFGEGMSEGVREIMLDAAGLAIVQTSSVDVRDVRIPLEEYLPIGRGPLVNVGCVIFWKVTFVREPDLVARTGRLKNLPNTPLGAVATIGKGQLLLGVTSSYGDYCEPFFRDGGIDRSDNEQAALALAEWLLRRR